jgi:hypothetical protein
MMTTKMTDHELSHQVFSKKGEFQRVLGETPGGGPGSGPGQLTEPRGLTFAKVPR